MPPASVRRACREFAADALKRQTRDFQRLGVTGLWEDPYLTMSNHYEAETARLFGRFVERGFVYKGARPVYWCIHDQTALAEAEVEYDEHTSPSVYVKFPLRSDPAAIDERLAGRKVFFLIWTTTPWTLPANVAAAVKPDAEYGLVHRGLAAGPVDRLDHELVQAVHHLLAVGGLLQAPGVDVGQDRLLAQVVADQVGHVRVEQLVVGDPVADRVGDGDVARAGGVEQARAPQDRVVAEGDRVEEVVVDPAVDHVHAAQPARGAHVNEVVEHHEVAPFHDLDPHRAGFCGLGLVLPHRSR